MKIEYKKKKGQRIHRNRITRNSRIPQLHNVTLLRYVSHRIHRDPNPDNPDFRAIVHHPSTTPISPKKGTEFGTFLSRCSNRWKKGIKREEEEEEEEGGGGGES